MKVKDGELVKVFQASASLCVSRGVMAAEAALRYYRSGETRPSGLHCSTEEKLAFSALFLAVDADLRFALERRLESDVLRRCVVYVHKVINADGQTPKTAKAMAPTEVKPRLYLK